MSTPDCVFMPEPSGSQSVSLPLCDSDSASFTLPASTVTPTPSVYLTFKVLQLVTTFRERVKTRVQNTNKLLPKKTQAKFCQDLDRLAYEEIDRYLGRKSAHSHTKPYVPTGSTACATKQRPAVPAQWLLDQINRVVHAENSSLTVVASSDKLFVRRKAELTISVDHLSTLKLTQLLVIVKDLLRSLSRLPSLKDSEDSISEGNEVLDVNFDEACIANLEHLLLCLRDQLLRLLVARLVALVHKHIVDCQRNQGQHSKTLFFEYPNAQHPLSTTWPWSIRPSLAVLWGVCWMFYDRQQYNNNNRTNLPRRAPTLRFDSQMNWVNEQGQVIAASAQIIPYLSQLQQQYHGVSMGNNTRQALNIAPRPRLSSGAQTMNTAPQFRGLSPTTHSPSPSHHHFPRTSGARTSVAHGLQPAFSLPDTNNNTYTAAPPPTYDAGPAAENPSLNWLPEDAAFDYNQSTAHTYQPRHAWPSLPPQAATEQHHQHQQQQHQATAFIPGYSQNLPPRSRHHLTPSISVTTDFSTYAGEFQPVQATPQDRYQSTTPVTSASSLHAPDSFNFTYNPNQLSPQNNTRFMNSDQQQQEMQTPPRSPGHQVVGGDSNSRKRSHSLMSAGGQVAPQSNGSRSGSVVSMHGQSGEEDYSSPRTRAFKREDPPPVNEEQKIICTFSPECAGLTFERKCEWTKHMDKHDRPYRCSNPACAKLQGFTYSGGLLRHEREVHNKHGGPKSALMCPYKDCKRHNGKGFTRKENLNEHVRRVHQNKDDQVQGMSLKRDSAAIDTFPGAENLDPAVAAEMEAFNPEDPMSPARKRRRQDEGMHDMNGGSDEMEALRDQIRILTEQNETKDSQLVEMRLQLEAEKQSRQEEMASMHDSIRLLQRQQEQQQVAAQAQAQTQS